MYASNPDVRADHALRYHSLTDNKYIAYFPGHRDKVVSLSLCPNNDVLTSSSVDLSVRWYDLKENKPMGSLKFDPSSTPVLAAGIAAVPVVAYEPQGTSFAVAIGPSVKLYDMRTYNGKDFPGGPFDTFDLSGKVAAGGGGVDAGTWHWSSIEFSSDGQYLLLASLACVFLVDAFCGELVWMKKRANVNRACLPAVFTPDAQFVIYGSDDAAVHVVSSGTGEFDVHLPTGYSHSPVGSAARVPTGLAWCPNKFMFACASETLALWAPIPLQ